MRLFVDLDTLAVSDYRNTAVTSLTAKRSDRFPVQVRFQSGGVVQELPHGTTGRIVLKKTSDYSGYPVAWSPGWRKVGYGSATYYVFQLSLHTQQVLDQFLILGGGELERVSFVFEIQWEHRGNRRSSRAVPFVVENDYVRLNDTMEPPTLIEEPPGPPIDVAQPQDYKATKLQAEQGEDNEMWMTPLRTAQAIAALAATDWASVSDKPATFPPATHGHVINDVTGLGQSLTALAAADVALDQRIDFITENTDPGVLDSISEAAASINGLQTQLDTHTHAAAEITDFAEAVEAVSPPVDWASLTGKPTSFPAEAHAHGNISNAGAIGSASGVPIITGANGVLQAGAFGTTAGTFAAGNHTHAGMLTTTGGITAIAVVAALPASPNANTLYLVTG